MAVDASSKLWVMNGATSPSLLSFPIATNGPAAPSQQIEGTKTLLVGVGNGNYQDIALDGDGAVWVPNWYDQNGPFGYITAYANSAEGDASPITTIGYKDKGVAEGIAAPIAVSFDGSGNLYVAEYAIPAVVVVFTPPFLDDSKPVAKWTLPDGDNAEHLAIDSKDNVYVLGFNEIDVFAGGLKSGGVISRKIELNGSYSYGVAADSNNRLYASDAGREGIGVYSKHASGDAQPKRIITSNDFGTGGPFGIAIGR